MAHRSRALKSRCVLAAALLLGAGGSQGANVSSELDVLRGVAQPPGFELALEPHALQFPQDHGPHPGFRHEWWYLTGHLDGAAGERFGFELTFFRIAVLPPTSSAAPVGSSAWRTRQIYTAHFAVTDVTQHRFTFAQKYARDALGLAGAQADPLRVWLDDWRLDDWRLDAEPEPHAISHDPDWQVHARAGEYELSLEAQPLMAPVLNGDRGLSRKGEQVGAASYYYSIPRIAVHGHLVRDGHPVEVKGLAWLDREWGSGSLARTQQGWDWFALQLEDGSTLMFYALRRQDGTRDSHSAGTLVDADGRTRALSSEDVRINVDDYWQSPRGPRYPSRWHVAVGSLGLDLEARPVLADQELDTKPRYWEGAVDVHGTERGHDISGRGYVELVGYGE